MLPRSKRCESTSLSWNTVKDAWQTGMGSKTYADLTKHKSAFTMFSETAQVQCLFWVSIHHFDLIYPFAVLSCIDYCKPIIDGRLGSNTFQCFENATEESMSPEEVWQKVSDAALQLDLKTFNSLGQHPYLARRFDLTAYMSLYIFILTANYEEKNEFYFEMTEEQRAEMVNEWRKDKEHCDLVNVAIAAHALNLRCKFFCLNFFFFELINSSCH